MELDPPKLTDEDREYLSGPDAPMVVLDPEYVYGIDDLPVRERYEAPPPAVGSKEWLGNEVDQAFGFPSRPRSEPGVIDVTEGRRPAAIEVGEYEPEGPYRPFKGRGGES